MEDNRHSYKDRILRFRDKSVALVMDGFINGLGICRSLKKADSDIITVVLTSVEGSAISYSRFVDMNVIASNEDEVIELITQLCGIADDLVIYPCSDKNVISLKNIANIHPKLFDLISTISNTIFEKQEQQAVALRCNMDVPISQILTNQSKFEDIKYPVMVKPNSGLRAPFKAEIARDNKTLKGLIERCEKDDCQALVSDYIEGDDTTLWTYGGYAYQGECIGYFTGHKVSQKPKNRGVATLAISKINTHVIEQSDKFLEAVNHTGLFQIEYKYSKANDKYYFIEFNPRNWAWGITAMHSNVNLPFIKWMVETKGLSSIKRFSTQRDGQYYFWLEGFTANVVAERWYSGIVTLLKLILNPNKRMVPALFKLSDPLPWFVSNKNMIFYLLGWRSTHR